MRGPTEGSRTRSKRNPRTPAVRSWPHQSSTHGVIGTQNYSSSTSSSKRRNVTGDTARRWGGGAYLARRRSLSGFPLPRSGRTVQPHHNSFVLLKSPSLFSPKPKQPLPSPPPPHLHSTTATCAPREGAASREPPRGGPERAKRAVDRRAGRPHSPARRRCWGASSPRSCCKPPRGIPRRFFLGSRSRPLA